MKIKNLKLTKNKSFSARQFPESKNSSHFSGVSVKKNRDGSKNYAAHVTVDKKTFGWYLPKLQGGTLKENEYKEVIYHFLNIFFYFFLNTSQLRLIPMFTTQYSSPTFPQNSTVGVGKL